ncbi:YbcC family protein [Maricaulaceae bacterium MS644]
MFDTTAPIAQSRVPALLAAAERAARAIPPAFPLEATVAVNPFLGQTGENLAATAARLARVGGVAMTRPRALYAAQIRSGHILDIDLQGALDAETDARKPRDLAALIAAAQTECAPPQALPSVADLAAEATGVDWPSVFEKTFGLWASGYFDEGQALWTPAPGQSAYSGWQAWATHDLTPEIAGLDGFCAHVAAAPDTAARAIVRAVETLGVTDAAAETVFHRLLMEIGGWAQHARWMLWRAELAGGTDEALGDLLAIRLVWEEALLAATPSIAKRWRDTIAAHEEPVTASADQIADAILQGAAERAHQRTLADSLTGAPEGDEAAAPRPSVQAAFCIDVRSEIYRRALEAQSTDIETIGFAGFFGLPLAHTTHGSDVVEAHLPVLLNPAMESTSHTSEPHEHTTRIQARAARAWGRFRQAAVSSFAFIEAAGLLYGAKLVTDALGLKQGPSGSGPAPRVLGGLSAKAKAETAVTVLNAMGMTSGFARVVLLLGHGAKVANNPHESAYHCGACGGYTGEVSARLLARLLNDPETRAGLPAHGLELPADTVFVAGLHDTTRDEVTLFEDGDAGTGHGTDHGEALAQAKRWLSGAGRLARGERALRLAGAREETVAARAYNWAEVRPEWGLAGCAAFIAAPRAATASADLGGRAFLHSYDWRVDTGFSTLELILTAPVVVASWISLQYYGSTVAPDVFGGGNKLIHNVVGGIGVVEGNGGRLRPGLPWQAVHDGEAPAHEALRLSVYVEAPQSAITEILERHPGVRALFDNGWLHLFTLDQGRVAARYRPGLAWTQGETASVAA